MNTINGVLETIDLTHDVSGEPYGENEVVRVTVSESLARTGVLGDPGGPSQLIHGLVSLPDLPACPTYAQEVTPPKPICGICKSLGSNTLALVWHVGRQTPAVKITYFQIWMCEEPYEEWKKRGDVVALTPPMSCILAKVPYGISHFTVRAVDSEGRYGPFAVPASLQRRAAKGTMDQ